MSDDDSLSHSVHGSGGSQPGGGNGVPTPKMGGKHQQPDGKEVVWTGGVPKANWSGLKEPNPKSIHPTQYRPSSIGSSTKSQYYRTTGLTTKFTRKSDLLKFQTKVQEHLEEYGMDTIAYLPSPTDSTEMVSIISNHARYTLKEAKQQEKNQLTKYDLYDHANERDAKKFLMESIDEDLETQLYENCQKTDSFIVHWMNLMLLVGSISIDRFDRIKG